MTWDSPEIGDAGPRIGPWMSEAFNVFGRSWKPWIIHGAVAVLLPGVIALVGFGALLALGVRSYIHTESRDWPALFMVAPFVALLVLFAVAWCSAGMLRSAVRQLRGGEPDLADLKLPWVVGLRSFACLMVMLLVGTIGMALCVVPGLMVAGALFYAPGLIAVEGMGVAGALRTSVEMNRRHFWPNVLWAFLVGLIGQAGGVVIFGHIATLPLSLLMMMVGYRDSRGLPDPEEWRAAAGAH